MLERDLGVIVERVIVFVVVVDSQVGNARFAEELVVRVGNNPDGVVSFVDGFSTASTSAFSSRTKYYVSVVKVVIGKSHVASRLVRV
tara:strand:+ start:1303 stop:1563 length:261 start_codon:yes stop_codon:yes gene_type:complete